MDALIWSSSAETTSQTLHRLDATITWMWSSEPACCTDERRVLLERLAGLSSAVERLAFRHEFDPDDVVAAHDLDHCATELDALERSWSGNLAPAARATDEFSTL